MKKENQIDDLRHIRDLMERSSKFLSLSGLSGICAGVIALLSAAFVYVYIFKCRYFIFDETLDTFVRGIIVNQNFKWQIILAAVVTIVLAGGVAWYFCVRKAKKAGEKLWSPTAKRTLYHFLIPLAAGGILGLALIVNNNIYLVAPITLIFYGLALINAGKFTFGEIHYLGICEIALGLIGSFCLSYGFFFWVVGFGILHIVYGIWMYIKYDRIKVDNE